MEFQHHRWVFFHDGPGLNAEAERRFWKPSLLAAGVNVHFWDEPRENVDPAHAFEVALASAAQTLQDAVVANQNLPVGLIAHGFGANIALEVAHRFPSLVSQLVFFAPATQIYTAFLRVMRIGHEEATRTGAFDAALRIEQCLTATQTFPDNAMLEGLETALSQSGTKMRFWHSLENFERYEQLVQNEPWKLDRERQLNGWLSSAQHLQARSSLRLNIPAWIGFGAEDEVISRADEVRYLSQRFPIIEQKTFESAGHCLHLEAPTSVSAWLYELQGSPSVISAAQTSVGEQTRRTVQNENT